MIDLLASKVVKQAKKQLIGIFGQANLFFLFKSTCDYLQKLKFSM